jgi:F1F0 ATPase subunit 2
MSMAGDLLLGAMGGLALAALHLAWLWRAAQRLAGSGSGAAAVLGGAALRLAVLIAGFAAIALMATNPPFALVAALISFAVLRGIALRRARNAEN